MKFNNSSKDVWLRDILIGLLVMLNDKLKIENGDKIHNIKFYLPFANDERWMQDFFTDYKNCEGISKFVDGNIDYKPRGSVQLSGISIDSSALTNNFVRGYFTQENNEGLLEYKSAEILHIPFNMSVNIEMLCSDLLESYKIFEQVIKVFHKTVPFNTTHNGFLLQCVAGFSDDFTLDSQFEFGFDEKDNEKLEFDLEVECYMPIIFEDTIIDVTDNIERFKVNIFEFNKRLENLLKTFTIPK